VPLLDDDPYDRLPYTDHAYAESHPDRLAVVARLAGWEPPEVADARVLELGCGRGGNLLPMLAGLPGARGVGLDRSRRQIEEARAIAVVAGVTNARFVEASFESLVAGVSSVNPAAPTAQGGPADAAGPFDYVIAHGIASWVPPASRRALLGAVSGALAPGGLAYVSFNVLPGWYERLAARDWLRYEAQTRAAGAAPGASLVWLRDRVAPEQADYRRRLDAVARRLGETDSAYAKHEYLSDHHHPQLVRAFLAEAADAGLAYLGDAIPSETARELLPDDVRDRARAMSTGDAQQLIDFVRNTAFRRAVLVRADEANRRGWTASPELRSDALEGLRVASRLRAHEETPAGARGPLDGGREGGALSERFDAPDVSVQIDDIATRRALHELARVAPRSLPCPEVVRLAGAQDPAALRSELLHLWLATGAIDLHAHEPALAVVAGRYPQACPVARWHAAHGGAITNRWHQEVRLDEAPLRRVLALLDGSHTVEDVARAIGGSVDRARASVEALASVALIVT
jgi:SAM-dependent methyltransferase